MPTDLHRKKCKRCGHRYPGTQGFCLAPSWLEAIRDTSMNANRYLAYFQQGAAQPPGTLVASALGVPGHGGPIDSFTNLNCVDCDEVLFGVFRHELNRSSGRCDACANKILALPCIQPDAAPRLETNPFQGSPDLNHYPHPAAAPQLLPVGQLVQQQQRVEKIKKSAPIASMEKMAAQQVQAKQRQYDPICDRTPQSSVVES
ncbi:hypothetical protein QBC44DRAFT_312884 [Cladorrhinum sp. PSN332]|nr:hypothetical protein QBC44DRAFT_312884 [Cladorrhinum sp. PSN332]